MTRTGETRRPPSVLPDTDESLLGWLSRTAAARGDADVGELLEKCGLPLSSRLRAVITGDLPRDRVAALLGDAPLREVRARTLVATDRPGFALFRATVLRVGDVVVARRRFASAALAANPIHRGAWMVGSLPFCPSTFEFLKDTCLRCGTVQKWRPTMNVARCDRCGSRLERQAGEKVAEGLVDGLSDLARHAGLVAPDCRVADEPLPDAIGRLGGPLLYELVNELAAIVDGRPRGGLPAAIDAASQRSRTDALARAWDMARRWPESLLAIARRDALQKGTSRNLQRLLKNYERVPSHADCKSRARAPAHPEVAALLLGCFADDGKGVEVKAARVALDLSHVGVTMAQLARTVGSRPVFRDGLIRIAFDEKELAALRAIRTDRVSAREAGLLIGLPTYAVADLIDAGLLELERHPWLLEHYGRPLLTRRAVEGFAEGLRRGSFRNIEKGIPLSRVLRGYGGGPKPWAAVLAMLFGGRLRYRWVGASASASSLEVPAASVDAILELPRSAIRDHYSQEDAAEILNIKYGNVAHSGWAALRLTSRSRGRLDGRRLAARAAARITIGEISARSGTEPVTLVSMLRARGCERIDEMGYDRSAVLPLVRGMIAEGTLDDRTRPPAAAPVSLGACTPS